MRALVLSLLMLIAAPVWAQDQTDIPEVIQQQLDAFAARDVDRAFSFASPNIKGIFGTPGNFGMMVQRGYPMVWDPGEVRFLELREVAGRLYQRVLIRDGQGVAHVLEYEMTGAQSGWQINGVAIVPAPEVGA